MSVESGTEKRFEEFETKMRALVYEYHDVLAPFGCPLHSMEDCECSPDTAVALPDFMMTEWFLGSSWVRLEDGMHAYNYTTNQGALMSHTLGLLHMVQYKIEEQM